MDGGSGQPRRLDATPRGGLRRSDDREPDGRARCQRASAGHRRRREPHPGQPADSPAPQQDMHAIEHHHDWAAGHLHLFHNDVNDAADHDQFLHNYYDSATDHLLHHHDHDDDHCSFPRLTSVRAASSSTRGDSGTFRNTSSASGGLQQTPSRRLTPARYRSARGSLSSLSGWECSSSNVPGRLRRPGVAARRRHGVRGPFASRMRPRADGRDPQVVLPPLPRSLRR